MKARILKVCLLASVLVVCLQYRATGGEVSRKVLGVFNSKDARWVWSSMHKHIQMPVNRMGLVMDKYDASSGSLPDYAPYRAIIISMTSDHAIPHYRKYIKWLIDASKAGVRIVAFNGFGVEGYASAAELKPLLTQMDLKQGEVEDFRNPFKIKYTPIVKDAFNFEVTAPASSMIYKDFKIKQNATGLRPWLVIERTDVKDSEAIAVAAGEKGGIIISKEYSMQEFLSPIFQYKWYINPFMFLNEALGAHGQIRPDVTTQFGCRAAYSHIDGDGMLNMVQDIAGKDRSASAILYKWLLKKYPVPVGVSYVAVRLTKDGGLTDEFMELFRKIMALPNVIPAAHGYTHPMNWEKQVIGIKVKGYKYSVKSETVGALNLVTKLTCPKGKEAKIFFWTGDCTPGEDALKELGDKGMLNLNGGDPRYDALYDSVSNICALNRQVGKYRQIYTSGSNEYLYTNGWTENFGGFVNVIKTFMRSKKPRLLPVNIYYHIYTCERQTGVRALRQVYDWALNEDLCWISPNEYVESVNGFIACKSGTTSDGGQWVSDYGQLKTLRIDNEPRHVDMTRSKNILGYTHFDGTLYISLLPGKEAVVYLQENEGKKLFIRRSTSKLEVTNFDTDFIKFKARLYPKGFVEFGGYGKDKLEITVNGKKVKDSGGRIELPEGFGEWIDVTCRVMW